MVVREPHDPKESGDADLVARRDRSAWSLLLLLPLVVTLYPPLYNRETPRLFDIPFFYWYQLAAIAIGVTSTVIVFRKTRV